MKNTMGQIIAAKRKELGMTQLELAEKNGRDRQGGIKVGERPLLPGCQFSAEAGGNFRHDGGRAYAD